MTWELIIVIGLAVLAIVIAFKLLKKIVKIVVSIAIIIAAVAGIYLYTDIFEQLGIVNKQFEFSVEQLENKYCTDIKDAKDSVKCYLIIKPICDEIRKKLTEKELNEIKHNKKETIKIIKEAIKNKKSEIQEKLKEQNALYLWNDFSKDIAKEELINIKNTK